MQPGVVRSTSFGYLIAFRSVFDEKLFKLDYFRPLLLILRHCEITAGEIAGRK